MDSLKNPLAQEKQDEDLKFCALKQMLKLKNYQQQKIDD